MKLHALAAAGLLIGAGAVACGYARLPQPRYVRQPTSALVEVPYPPPPARAEFVPARPRDGAVWLDGEWLWQGRRWAWRRGRWVIPSPGAAFSPRALVRNEAGTLFWAEGRWRDAKTGVEVADPPVLAIGHASPGEVVDAEGDTTSTGQDVVPEGTAPRQNVAPAPS